MPRGERLFGFLDGFDGPLWAADSARWLRTSTLASARGARRSLRNAAFLPVASRSVKRSEGMVMASGMPGSPPPEPTSMTREFSGSSARMGMSVRESRMWRVQASAGSRMAVRLKALLASRRRAR